MKLQFKITTNKQFYMSLTLMICLLFFSTSLSFFGGSFLYPNNITNQIAAISKELSKHDTSDYNRVIAKVTPKNSISIEKWNGYNEIGNKKINKKNFIFSISKYVIDKNDYYISGFDLSADLVHVNQDLKFVQNCMPKNIDDESIIISSDYADSLIRKKVSANYEGIMGSKIDIFSGLTSKNYHVSAIFQSKNDYMCTNSIFTYNFGETFFVQTRALDSFWDKLGADFYTTFSPSLKNNLYYEHLLSSMNPKYTFPVCRINDNFDKNGTNLKTYLENMYSSKNNSLTIILGILLIFMLLISTIFNYLLYKSASRSSLFQKFAKKKYVKIIPIVIIITAKLLVFVILYSTIKSISIFGTLLMTPSKYAYWLLIISMAVHCLIICICDKKRKQLN